MADMTYILFTEQPDGAVSLAETRQDNWDSSWGMVGKPVEFLRTGVFYDMLGRRVEFTEADLDKFVDNFAAGAAGQDIPIDIDHRFEKAAGWIRRVWRTENKLEMLPEWNMLGVDLVGSAIYRYVSATIDIKDKVVRAVSLVNLPLLS